MKKTKKFGHIISLSKPPSLSKQFKYPTSLPSPRNGSKKLIYQVQSPKKEDELILIKRKFLNKSKYLQSTSNFLSFAHPLNKKNSLNANTSIKSQLLLSSIDMSLIQRDDYSKEKRKIVISSSAINNTLSQARKKNPQTSMNSRKNSCDKTININSSSNNTNRIYSKLLEKYSKDNVKKMLYYKKGSSQLPVKTKRKIASTTCSSPVNTKYNYNKGLINFQMNNNNYHNIFNKKKFSKSKSIQYDEKKYNYLFPSSSLLSKKYSSNNSNQSLKKDSKSSIDKNKTTKNSSTNLHNICVNCINTKLSTLQAKHSTKNNKPNSKPTSKSKSKKSTSSSSYKILTSVNSILHQKLSSLAQNSKKDILKKHQQNIQKYFTGLNSPLNHNIIHSPSTLNSLSDLPLNPSLSTLSSSNNDTNYYLGQSNKLSKFIQKYYAKYKNYPPTSLAFYKYGRLIGQGAFGKVNLGLNVLTGRVVAIKSFNKAKNNEDNKNKIIYETNMMRRLYHPAIVKILEMFESDKYILITMEYINGGNLYSFVKKRRKLTEKTAKFLFWQIIQGIKYMHSRGVVHRDIKLENILIDLNNNVKICDFGIGKVMPSTQSPSSSWILHEQCGTPMYIAPEILLSTKESGYEAFPVDLWSAGIALYIMLSGTLPFTLNNNIDEVNHNNNNALQYAIINSDPNPIEGISKEAKDLLKGLLDKNPKTRYTPDIILNHPWFRNENFNNNPEKYHLFTKAEMIMLSKTYIDYRYAKLEDLKESFTLTNLNMDDTATIPANMKNNDTKSLILAPFNSMVTAYANGEEDEPDFYAEYSYRNNLMIENDNLVFSNKVKEFNMNYELNNNGELDNGILINSKFDIENNTVTTESVYYYDEDNKQMMEKTQGKEKKEREEMILNKIEKLGYDKNYVRRCLNNNELCYATAVYYLMENYDHID